MVEIEVKQVTTPKCGVLNIYIQGNRSPNEVIIFTIHDLGCNHKEYEQFLEHTSMKHLRNRCVWIHLDIPGQGDNDEDLNLKEFVIQLFPTMQEIADDIKVIFDELNIQHAVLFGEGAGANILARFAMNNDDKVLGIVLIHCTGTTAGIKEAIRDRLITWKLNTTGMNPVAESYLVVHRFGEHINTNSEKEFREMINGFKRNLQASINPRNLNKFILSFMNRSNIAERIYQLKCPALFVTGNLASHNHTVMTLYNTLQKFVKDDPERIKKLELIQVNGVANVLKEKPEKIAESLQYFLQGLGLVGGLRVHSLCNPLSRRLSMEQLDLPRGPDSLSSIRKGSMPIQH